MAYPTSEAYKTAVAQNSRTWRLRINMSLDTQQQLELTESDVTLGSLVFEEASTCSDVIDVGSTYANSLDFSIYNPDHKYDGYSFTYAWLTASVGLQTGENEDGSPIWEDIPLGQFFVQEEGKKMSTIPLKCLDRMVKLNVPFNNIPLLASDTPISMMDKIATKCGITIEPATQALIDTLTEPLIDQTTGAETEPQSDSEGTEAKGPFPDGMTCRDFVGYCAALFGKNARFNRQGDLEFYRNVPANESTESPVTTTPDTRLSDLTFSERPVQITGVTMTDAVGNLHPKGEENFMVTMDANPLLTTEKAALIQSALDETFAALTVPYKTFETGIIGDPSIQAGDPICHKDVLKEGNNLYSVITGHTFKFRGNGSLKAVGKLAEEDRQLTASNKKILEVQTKAKIDLNDAVDGMAKAIANQTELLTNSLGFYVDYEIDPETGRFEHFWLMDAPEAENATVIWRITEQGWQASDNGGETWNSGWDAGGNIIARSITADLVKAQTLRALDELAELQITDGNIVATTENGETTINGKDILLKYLNEQGKMISCIQVSSDADEATDIADMRLNFMDNKSNVLSCLGQRFTHDAEGNTTSIEPLTITDLRVNSKLEVTDSLVYDRLVMQRKSEAANSGVDFVVMED